MRAETSPPVRGIHLPRARELTAQIAECAQQRARGRPAPLARLVRAAGGRVRDRGPRPGAVQGFAELPQIVAVLERGERRALGVTIDGVTVELLGPDPATAGTALLRATGDGGLRRRARPAPGRRHGGRALRRARASRCCPPELREAPFAGEPPRLVELADIRGDMHCHTTWSDGRASVEQMGRAARDRGYEYLAICDHTPAGRRRPGPHARRRPPPSARDRRRQRSARAVPGSCAGSSATSSPTAGSTSPTTSWPSSTGSRPASTAASACRAPR